MQLATTYTQTSMYCTILEKHPNGICFRFVRFFFFLNQDFTVNYVVFIQYMIHTVQYVPTRQIQHTPTHTNEYTIILTLNYIIGKTTPIKYARTHFINTA